MRRTLLFIPANNPNMMMNGGLLGADSIIFDLEDAVSPDEKDAARELLKNTLQSLNFGKCERIIRINGLDTPYWEEDLEVVVPRRPEVIMPPKVCDADYIRTLDGKLTRLEEQSGIEVGVTKIIALLETAMGIENAYEIARASARTIGLLLGAEDYAADMRCVRTAAGIEILYARGRLLSAARAAGIEAYDTPFTDIEDLSGLEADAVFAKNLGFSGKALISPGHVAIVNRAFSPTPAEVSYARGVFAALEEAKRQGKGAVSLHGKMIDAPIVLRAKSVLEAAAEIEGVDDFER